MGTVPHRRRLQLIAATLAGGLLMTACQGDARSAASPSTPSTPTAAADEGILPPLSSPLDAYRIRAGDLYTLQRAEEVLSAACMRRFGFDQVDRHLDREEELAGDRAADAGLYGITTRSAAARSGYGGSPDDESPAPEEPVSDAYQFIYMAQPAGSGYVPTTDDSTSPGEFGGKVVPPGGCLGEARTKLWGTPSGRIKDELAKGLRGAAYEAAMADPRVQRAIADWRTCLADQGFRMETPFKVPVRAEGTEASEQERAQAVADIDCKVKVDLVPRWNAVDVEYQDKAIEANQLALTEERSAIDAALDRAAKVVEGVAVP